MRLIGRGQRGDGEGHRTATCPRLPSLRQGTWGTASWERRSLKLFPSLERAASAQGDSPQGQIAALGSQWRRTLLPAAAAGGGTSRSSPGRGRQSAREPHQPPRRAAAGLRDRPLAQPHTQLSEIHGYAAQRNTSYLGHFNYLLQVIKCL